MQYNNTGVKAKIIADSVSPFGVRLTTFELRMHRFILPEFSKHRIFSMSVSSSRALPVARILEEVQQDPAIPVHWGVDQRGMVAEKQLSEQAQERALVAWLQARDEAVRITETLLSLEVHKQVANRLLEPFQWSYVVCTATSYGNYFSLRNHEDAQPEIQVLAELMENEYSRSEPTWTRIGEWHLPKLSIPERNELIGAGRLGDAKRISAARCARASYAPSKTFSYEKDLGLFDRLINSSLIHSVPLEHVATPAVTGYSQRGNFLGWDQFRHEVEDAKGVVTLR